MKPNIFKLSIVNCQLSIITAALLLLFTACTAEEPATDASPAVITADTRAATLTEAATISLNTGGTTHATYTLATDGTMTPDANSQVYIAPGTTTLPVVAWTVAKIAGTDTPLLHNNPITPVTWSTDAQPTIGITLAPATTSIRLVVKDDKGQAANPTSATLHGIATPTGTWDATLPPTLQAATGNAATTLALTNGTHTQAIPGTVDSGKHLLTIRMTDGTEHTIIANRSYTFLPAYQYTINVTINTQGKAEITTISIADMEKGGTIIVSNVPADTYIISNETELITFRNDVNNPDGSGNNLNALQVKDITLTEEWTPIGNSNYTGTYNGGGYSISNLTIHKPNSDRQGLFGEVTATLINIHLKNPDVEGAMFVGALAGMGRGCIIQCSVEGGTVKGTEFVGGLVGSSSKSNTIVACYASTTVNGNNNGTGGLVGWNTSTIAFCYATGSVKNLAVNTGSLVGNNFNNKSNIISSYATGAVNDDPTTGKTVAYNDGGTIDPSCPEFNGTTPGPIVRTYTGPAILGFTADIWTDDEYPKLKWQK